MFGFQTKQSLNDSISNNTLWDFFILSNGFATCFCSFRLRLVRVKAFPENRYFPEMLFSGKEIVFMCLVAFQKNFRKIFSDVWLYS